MQVTVEGHQVDVGEALRAHAVDSINQISEKYFNHTTRATVVFGRENAHLFNAEIIVHVGKGIMVQATAKAADAYAAFDQTAEKVAKRLRRHKRRIRDHHERDVTPEFSDVEGRVYTLRMPEYLESETAGTETDNEAGTASNEDHMVVAEMAKTIQTMTVSDAVMRLELSEEPALMFRNASHGGLNMVYMRQDGNIGWVDPENNAAAQPAGAAVAAE